MRAPSARPIDGVHANAASRDRVWAYIAYYGMSEFAQRVTRLVTTVLIARVLTPVELGLAAVAITCFELLRVAANSGVGQAVIRASDARLAGTCITAHRLMWIVCAGLALVQTTVGALVAQWTGHDELFGMLALLSGVYLMMPAALIQTYLLQRNNAHAAIAKIATAQAVADNALTIVLALAGCGAWAIVIPKLATCPIWLFGMRLKMPWVADRNAAVVPMGELLRFSMPVLAAETLTTVRLQCDKVLVGAILGVEALGVYYFVFNAGIGLSLSLTGALSNALYPHFAEAASRPRELLQRLDRSLLRKAAPIAGIVLLQAALAPLYVPLLFGAKWSASKWLVAILCASASTKLFADVVAQALRAAGAVRREVEGTLVITALSLTALAAGATQGLAEAVTLLALVSGATQLGFATLARRSMTQSVGHGHGCVETKAL